SSACACSSRPRRRSSTSTSGERCWKPWGWARGRCPCSCTPTTTCAGHARAAPPHAAERGEMLEALGLGEGPLPRFVHAAYHLLGLRTFFTTGEKESRAWTLRAGWTAPQCAGVIHTDFEKGFIRAEVIHWDEVVELAPWAN